MPWSAEFLYFMHGMLASGLTVEATVREFLPSFGYTAFGVTLRRRHDGSNERHYYCLHEPVLSLVFGCAGRADWVVKAGDPAARIVPLTRHDPHCVEVAGRLGVRLPLSPVVESIAGYRVVVYRRPSDREGWTSTLALAPDLGCLPMRALWRSDRWWGFLGEEFHLMEVTAVRAEGLPLSPPPSRARHHP